MIPFVLFAHARSGSNNLAASLNIHPQIRVAEEPFHPKYSLWHPGEKNYSESIRGIESLDEALSELFSKYDGIKVLDYQLSEESYTHLLSRQSIKVIFLRRRNLLKAIVSGLIAEQTSVWRASDIREDRHSGQFQLRALPLEEVARKLKYQIDLQSYYREACARRLAETTLFVDFEDLYTSSLGHNRAVLTRIYSFLGVPIIDLSMADPFLDSSLSEISKIVGYEKLPNWREINLALGSDVSGFLESHT